MEPKNSDKQKSKVYVYFCKNIGCTFKGTFKSVKTHKTKCSLPEPKFGELEIVKEGKMVVEEADKSQFNIAEHFAKKLKTTKSRFGIVNDHYFSEIGNSNTDSVLK
jgi:hypothetical protein